MACVWTLTGSARAPGFDLILPDGRSELVVHRGDPFRQRLRTGATRIQPRRLIVGAAWRGAKPVWVPDITKDEGFRKVPIAMRAGLRTALAFPVAVGDQVLGVVEMCSTEVHAPDDA